MCMNRKHNIRCIKWIENDPTENNREQLLLPDGVGSHVAIRCDKNTPHQESRKQQNEVRIPPHDEIQVL